MTTEISTVILDCLNRQKDPARVERLEQVTSNAWPSVITLASLQRVLPLLYQRLLDLGISLPAKIEAQLRLEQFLAEPAGSGERLTSPFAVVEIWGTKNWGNKIAIFWRRLFLPPKQWLFYIRLRRIPSASTLITWCASKNCWPALEEMRDSCYAAILNYKNWWRAQTGPESCTNG